MAFQMPNKRAGGRASDVVAVALVVDVQWKAEYRYGVYYHHYDYHWWWWEEDAAWLGTVGPVRSEPPVLSLQVDFVHCRAIDLLLRDRLIGCALDHLKRLEQQRQSECRILIATDQRQLGLCR